MTDWRRRIVEVDGAETGGGAELILHRALRSMVPVTPKRANTPADVRISPKFAPPYDHPN